MDSIRQQLRNLQIRPKKRLGQHFVIDARVLQRIADSADLDPDDIIVEIGAGNGGLTAPLAQKAKKVYALEIDSALIPILQAQFADNERVEVVRADALKFDYAALHRRFGRRLKIVANLPYEISTPILFRFFEEREYFSLLVLMLQREVARRLVASPGSKEYGPLSLWTRLYTETRLLFPVSPQAFHPEPKVASAVVRFEFLSQPRIAVGDPENLRKVIHSAFTYRRKMLGNALRLGEFSHLPLEKIQEALRSAKIDPKVRGEKLSLEEFHEAALALSSFF
ncbi:MAG: 16S rRNA (adenine(1518)-N(6)/adenine(1519)-N(6))-dimethyltransferase RsmA [Deltaproteobacteria bacterium]|nr:16S rRNA (adenine(1518)-N(6)/adenine(1519)-N(6))-dimethyltransferase RsmA [Deltaproteobacteria bacterium]